MNSRIFLLGMILTCGTFSFSQVEISSDSESVKKEKKRKKSEEAFSSSVEAFAISNWSHTTRSLIENVEPYGDSLGKRSDEFGLGTWSFGLGVRSRINRFLTWEGGISFLQNGESYKFEGSDSTFMYSTKYRYIGMPLKLQYTYGEKAVQFYAGIGLLPQMFINYKYEEEYTNSVNETIKETIKTRSGYNSFVLSFVANIGVKLNLGSKTNLLIFPEYRYQFITSYEEQADYKHFGRALGVNFGISYQL